MSDYDPQRGRPHQADAAIDSVFDATDHRGPVEGDFPQVADVADDQPGGPLRPPSPAVTPHPAPPDDVLVKVSAVGTFAAVLVLIWLWRRFHRSD